MHAITDRSLDRSNPFDVESTAESLDQSLRDNFHAQIALEIDDLIADAQSRIDGVKHPRINRSIDHRIDHGIDQAIDQPAAPRPRYNGTEPCVGRDEMFLAIPPPGGFKVRNPHLVASQLCDGCAFREPCLEYGLEQSIGVWGGLDPAARAELVRARAAVAS